MEQIISINHLNKKYGKKQILNDINFNVNSGEIIAVVGTNGAGKTTLLKSILGLCKYKGEVEVLGLSPTKSPVELMQQVSFIADTATLPKWITCRQLLDYMSEMHPAFEREIAEQFLAETHLTDAMKVSEMSKGMVTQLHLALVLAIKSRLLVLDEPTLGLDIIRRKEFYNRLLEEYFDENNTIIITTHQIEEIERILTRVIFIDGGKIIADIKLEDIEQRYIQLTASKEQHQKLIAMQPLYVSYGLTENRYIFESVASEKLASLGKISIPELSDLFIALCKVNNTHKMEADHV